MKTESPAEFVMDLSHQYCHRVINMYHFFKEACAESQQEPTLGFKKGGVTWNHQYSEHIIAIHQL